MSAFNKYPNLPGVLVEFKDGGKQFRFNTTEANTDSILILGTATDGPVMEPIAVDENTVELIFGTSKKPNGAPNGATLIKAFNQAYEAGCRDIRLMRVTGSSSDVTISAPSKTVVEKTRHDEDLGYISGNALTEFLLNKKDVILETVKVYVKGVELDSKYIDFNCVDAIRMTNGDTDSIARAYDSVTIVIEENACDSGSNVSISYSYNEVEVITNNLVKATESNELILSHAPDNTNTLVIKKDDGSLINSSQYSLFNNIVKLNFTPSATDRFNVTFESTIVKSNVETVDNNGQPLKLNSSTQTFAMSSKPENLDEFFLYVDGAQVLNKNIYKVKDHKLELDLDYFNKSGKVSVSFTKETINEVKREIKIQSIFGGSVYNQSKVKVYELLTSDGRSVKVVELVKPSSKSGSADQSVIFSTLDFTTFGEMVEAINTYSGIFKATTATPNEDSLELNNIEEFFRRGEDGINVTKEEMFEALSGKRDLNGYLEKLGAYQILENYQVDWVVPVGVYADEQMIMRNQDFAYELALFCAISSFRNKTTLGVIGMKPLNDTSLASIQAHANYLKSFNHTYFMKDANGNNITDSEGNPIDLGHFISIVGGPEPLINSNVLSMRECFGPVMYAALNSILMPQSSPMNKKVPGTIGLKYSFSNSQLDSIVGNRIVTFGLKSSARGGFIQGAFVIDGPTSARVGSEYGRITTLKILREVSDHIREVSDPFIGEPNTIESRNALSAAIAKRLDNLLTIGMYSDYSFNIVVDSSIGNLDAAKIELGLTPPNELRQITTIVGLK